MIEQLFNLVKETSQQDIIDNPALPNEYNEQAVSLATESIFSGLQSSISNNGIQDVIGMFAGQTNSGSQQSMIGGMTNNMIDGLMTKFGIENQVAKQIASSVIPSVIGKLVSKTNDPSNNGFDINGVMGSLIGNNSNGGGNGIQIPGLQNGQDAASLDFGSILKTLTSGGLDSNQDGQIGLDDIAGLIRNSSSENPQKNETSQGGVMGMLNGLLGD